MLAQELIANKRNGEILSSPEIDYLIRGMIDGSVTESQMSAFAMAVFFKGMSRAECVALTSSLQHSGVTLDWSGFDLHGPVVDKHSTGGVGDKVSLMLAPMLAACGVHVPMISGRGLGHTGGTLDKMDSIPGYNTSPSNPKFQNVVAQVGCAIVGQTESLAPADKKLYGIRDVTATVESIPLITASILSKKLSAGLDALVMDVKTGAGAFAAELSMAQALATNIKQVGEGLGLPISSLITDMSQVLGLTAGNALEVIESIDYLSGKYKEPRLHDVTINLCAQLLLLSKVEADLDTAKERLNKSLDSGLSAEYFERMIVALGGPKDFMANYDNHLKSAPVVVPVYPKISGTQNVATINGRELGNAVVELGGGRRRPQDSIDHSVGLSQIKAIGESVDKNEPLLMLHAKSNDDAERAMTRILNAFELTESPVEKPSAIVETIC